MSPFSIFPYSKITFDNLALKSVLVVDGRHCMLFLSLLVSTA